MTMNDAATVIFIQHAVQEIDRLRTELQIQRQTAKVLARNANELSRDLMQVRAVRDALLAACELALAEANNCFAFHHTESAGYALLPRHIVALHDAIELVKT